MNQQSRQSDQNLRELAMKAVDQTAFYPSWGRARLEAMIKIALIGVFPVSAIGVFR